MSPPGNPSREIRELVELRRTGGLPRRQFLRASAAMGLTLPALATALSACGAPEREVAKWSSRYYPYGREPVATSVDEAIDWWLERTANDAVDWRSPEVTLSEAEIAELQRRAPRIGHQWYGLYVPAVAGWNEFWLDEVSQWAPKPTVYDVQGRADRDIRGAQALVGSQIAVAGTLAVNWNLFGAAMRKYQAADIPTTSVVAPSSAYYPTTCTLMPDQVECGRSLALPMAEILARNGITDSDVVFIPSRQPAYFDIAREIGLEKGVNAPETQSVARLNFVRAAPAGESTEVESAVAQVLATNPDAHVIAVLSYRYAGAAAAIRSAGRRDVWIIAFDLEQGTATQLLDGGWPVAVAYSLPIAQLGRADAHVMGKILLGKDVPLIVTAEGTPTTSANVAQAYSNDWGGRSLPWT